MPFSPASEGHRGAEMAEAAAASAPAEVAHERVWADLQAEVRELAELSRGPLALEAFYGELLRRAVAALGAVGGAVWLAGPHGRFRQACVVDGGQRPSEPEPQAMHAGLLAHVARRGEPQTFPPGLFLEQDGAGNPGVTALVASPVVGSGPPGSAPPAVVEVNLPAGGAPSLYRGAERLLALMCEIAARRHEREEVLALRELTHAQRALLDLAERVGVADSLRAAAYTLVNEARDAIGCDRVSLLVPRGRRRRLLAVSGVDRPDPRSPTVRLLKRLADACLKVGEPLYLTDGQEDASPAEADLLHQYADASHARQVVVAPMRLRPGVSGDPDGPAGPPVGVLVAEQFDGAARDLLRDRVADAASVCAPPLHAAATLGAVPWGWVWRRPLAQRLRSLAGWLVVAALAGGAVAGLTLVRAPVRVAVGGELQPVQRSEVFAPRSAVVREVHVEHGDHVRRGDPLLTLRDADLELEAERLAGEWSTVRRQLASARAARSNLDPSRVEPAEAYRLSAEEQQLAQKLAALAAERKLLESQRQDLEVVSPADGMVVSWRVAENLRGRPVERGDALLTIAQTDGAWRLELEAPDDRVGGLVEAQRNAGPEGLLVEYRLGVEERGFATARLQRIAQRVDDASPRAEPDARRTVTLHAKPDADLAESARRGVVRPGLSVRARVVCPERPLAQVWLGDLWNTLRVWWDF